MVQYDHPIDITCARSIDTMWFSNHVNQKFYTHNQASVFLDSLQHCQSRSYESPTLIESLVQAVHQCVQILIQSES